MPETKNYLFDYKELAETLVRKLDLHEGLWGVYFELALSGATIPVPPDGKNVSPAGIVFINKVGIQRFDAATNLTVNAAEVNPLK
jgi:hypothetical protein